MNTMKELKDLNLLDRFLFAEAAEDPEFLEQLLQIILGKNIDLKELPQAEKETRKTTWSKQIRLDVWAMDQDGTVYDTEVQKKNTKNLPKRSRLYHGVIDSKLLEPGVVDYNQLPDSYVIMIMPFDLGGQGLYRYTFEMRCKEIPGLRLGDGATRIFLNTRGTVQGDASQELVDLLKYMEDTTAERAGLSGSSKICSMHKIVERIRSSEEIGVKYMHEWEEKILERQEARQEGYKEGVAAGRESGIEDGIKMGRKAGLEDGAAAEKKSIAAKLKEKGFSSEDIAEITGLSVDELESF